MMKGVPVAQQQLNVTPEELLAAGRT